MDVIEELKYLGKFTKKYWGCHGVWVWSGGWVVGGGGGGSGWM